MKYIKQYESNSKYKEGDYIIIMKESKLITRLVEKWNMQPIASELLMATR
jgi:hypothetical protein